MTHDALAARELCEQLKAMAPSPDSNGMKRYSEQLYVEAADLLELLLADLTAANARVKGLNAHVEAMQAMCTAYLAPEIYVGRDGTRAGPQASRVRTDTFAEDMIYMLDGPEQREAQGPVRQWLADREGRSDG